MNYLVTTLKLLGKACTVVTHGFWEFKGLKEFFSVFPGDLYGHICSPCMSTTYKFRHIFQNWTKNRTTVYSVVIWKVTTITFWCIAYRLSFMPVLFSPVARIEYVQLAYLFIYNYKSVSHQQVIHCCCCCFFSTRKYVKRRCNE